MRNVLALALAGVLLVAATPAIQVNPVRAAGSDYFVESSHSLSGPIRDAWQAGGGLWVFGYPISEPFSWPTSDGQPVVAQYFERARLEYHPALDGTPYRVLGGLLGVDLTAGRTQDPEFRPAPPDGASECVYMSPTGHNLCSHFREWWEREGGLAVFGYPLSEPLFEGGFEVQYFERARLEYHPENAGTRWEVELGHLGISDAETRGLLDSPAFQPDGATTTATRVASTLRSSPWGEPEGEVAAGSIVSVIGGPSFDSYLVWSAGEVGWIEAGDLEWTVRADPRQASRAALEDYDPSLGVRIADGAEFVSAAIYDPLQNRIWEGGDSAPVAGASLSKALLLAVALRQSEQRGDARFGDYIGTLESMIEYSDNDAANVVWSNIGGLDGMDAFLADTGLSGFATPDYWDWGAITATASDWAMFFGLLGSGQLLNPANTALALSLMHSVMPEHRWGVLTPGDDRLSIGKNGWYLDEGSSFDWRVNSAGFVDAADGPRGVVPLAVVVLTIVPGEYGMEWGVTLADDIQKLVIADAGRRWASPYLAVSPPEGALSAATPAEPVEATSRSSLVQRASALSDTLTIWSH